MPKGMTRLDSPLSVLLANSSRRWLRDRGISSGLASGCEGEGAATLNSAPERRKSRLSVLLFFEVVDMAGGLR
jgi:hypothetical protein